MALSTRFLHTSDWQLGMRRHFLKEEALPRYMQARIDAIAAIGKLAKEHKAQFVTVAGDVFESNQVDRRTVGRALEALASVPCPVLLLPGNHDPLDAASVYRSRAFRAPANVSVIDSAEPVEIVPGVEVVGAPWPTKRPPGDLVEAMLRALEPTDGLRVAIAHGAVNVIEDRASQIELEPVRAALADHRIHFLGLGDRHSVTEVAPRVWYSGSPEPTDYVEVDPGKVLLVDLSRESCDVEALPVARWRFLLEEVEVASGDDVQVLADRLFGLPDKDRTILKLVFTGALTLREHADLEAVLADQDELFAAIERYGDVTVRPEEFELEELGLTGFARDAAFALAERDDQTARDSLALLYRLTQAS
jgi:DNA repair exonuclease SbcCD nuclease subunit